MDEIFDKVGDQTDPSQLPESHHSDCITIQDVRITPAHMVFANAYEGKQFNQKLTIQNCGHRLVFIRLDVPTSNMFQYKSFKEGRYLSPGMKIVRIVKYTYNLTFGVTRGFTTIWVNDEELLYRFMVSLSKSILAVEPQQLDFGRIDAVNHASTRTFYVKNLGTKGTSFSIDLGRTSLEMAVQPLKGAVPAMSSVAVTVEIVGSKEGEFAEEFWVKGHPPIRVVVSGYFISPKLLVRKFINSLDFTLVDFPPTYYGSKSTQALLIKNFSSSNSMFCVMAEIKGTTMPLDEAREIDQNYKNFAIHPLGGRLAALGGAAIQLTFAPVKGRKEKNYAACFLKVIRMDCRDVTNEDKITDVVKTKAAHLANDAVSFIASATKDFSGNEAVGGSFASINDEEVVLHEDTFSFEHSIGVCLHGEKETAGITLRPTYICLEGLTLGQVYNRELLVTNRSKKLPVRVKYNKIPAIDVVPQQFDLTPEGSKELLVTIRTLKLDRVNKRITFDLLGCGLFDKSYTKVGRNSLEITFEATELEKKTKLKQCAVCTDIVPKLAPDFPYRLSSTEALRKTQNQNYYINYIRSLQKIAPELDPLKQDYDITNLKLLKMENVHLPDLCTKTNKVVPHTHFVPLSPRLLYNIKISPKSVRLRKVAAFTVINDCLQIENLNSFPIYVFVKASKTCIAFEENHHKIKSKEKKKINFSFTTSHLGRYYVNINVLINNSTLYEVTAVAEVVPKTLNFDVNKIHFTEQDPTFKFFKVINKLNAYTSFDWEVLHKCFKIYPESGGISAEEWMYCMVDYKPDPVEPKITESVLTSESGQRRILKLSFKKREHCVIFDTYNVDLGLVPLNIPIKRKIILKNLKDSPVLYAVLNRTPVPGIEIDPKSGQLDGLDSQVFTINIQLNAVIEVSTEICFVIDVEDEVKIPLRGAVEYPKICFKPEILYFRKISPFSFDTLAFKISNLCKCETRIDFPLEDTPEFLITESEDDQARLIQLVLPPEKSKVLYLHFQPNYISTYSFCLPYVINNILGPTFISSSRTSSPQYFLENNIVTYEEVPNVLVKNLPRSLSIFRINCSAIDKIVEFSKMTVNFVYFGEEHYSNVTSSTVEITNVSSSSVGLCIRTDDLSSVFSLTPVEDSIEEYSLSYKVELEPGQKINFQAEFYPGDLGEYCVRLPIFLRGYHDNKIFNYLTLEGVYGTPRIVPDSDRCDFEPVPCHRTNEMSLVLHLYNHFDDCIITCNCEEAIISSFGERTRISEEEVVQNLNLMYNIPRIRNLDLELIVYCSCQSMCKIAITGAVENCLLTTHAFSHFLGNDEKKSRIRQRSVKAFSNKNTTCFPLFPEDCDQSAYGEYMRGLQKTLETWLFTQVFYKKCYYRIPEGFSDFCKVDRPGPVGRYGGTRNKKLLDLPLLEMVGNIAGRAVRKQLSPSFPKEDDELHWLSYTSKANTNVLLYLRGFAVLLPHVKSKYLLNYDQYLLYEKQKRHKNPLKESTFYRLSKQCWIDLILQIIKLFFLFRSAPISDLPNEKSVAYVAKNSISFSAISRISLDEEFEDVLDVGIYGWYEKTLIEWLVECYEDQRKSLWWAVPAAKEVVYLDEDLHDGLILGAVTARYCPYMASEIKEMYTRPYNPEEVFHNLCILVKTWTLLKFSYVLSPLELQKSGMVEMLLLVLYLYDVLPHYSPREVIAIQAPLTQTSTTPLELENFGEDPIIYKVVFFGNDHKLFVVPFEYVVLEPRSRKTVTVKYHAKSVTTTTTTLLFCGETPKKKYGKSIVVTLKGVADVTYSCMQISLNVDLYRLCNVTIETQSPFKVKTKYTLYFGYQPVSKEKNLMFPWNEIKRFKTVKEFVLRDEICEFDEDGKCSTEQLICCQQLGPRDIYMYFTNPEVGDWAIHIDLKGRVNDLCYETIEVPLPESYGTISCRCNRKPNILTNCPTIIHAKIPMKNNPLWDARKRMVLQYVEGEELKFWSKRIFTPTGTRILKLILNSETHPIRQPIEETVEYRVVLKKKGLFITSHRIIIDDVTCEDFFDLLIHPLQDLSKIKMVQLEMVSMDGKEHRFYKLMFTSVSNTSLLP